MSSISVTKHKAKDTCGCPFCFGCGTVASCLASCALAQELGSHTPAQSDARLRGGGKRRASSPQASNLVPPPSVLPHIKRTDPKGSVFSFVGYGTVASCLASCALAQELGSHTPAQSASSSLVSGKRAGDILAANCSPTPGTDKEGATAVIRSYCKADLTKLTSGAALDLKLLPSSVEGEDGLAALVGLMRSFSALGGFFMQPDVVDASLLREAQQHPEEYTALSVRVSGWNARFVTLNREWQNMVIEQNEH